MGSVQGPSAARSPALTGEGERRRWFRLERPRGTGVGDLGKWTRPQELERAKGSDALGRERRFSGGELDLKRGERALRERERRCTRRELDLILGEALERERRCTRRELVAT
jgi:hypothetical protein